MIANSTGTLIRLETGVRGHLFISVLWLAISRVVMVSILPVFHMQNDVEAFGVFEEG